MGHWARENRELQGHLHTISELLGKSLLFSKKQTTPKLNKMLLTQEIIFTMLILFIVAVWLSGNITNPCNCSLFDCIFNK